MPFLRMRNFYPLSRLVDLLIPFFFILTGLGVGFITFLHLLFIDGKPGLAFNFSYWQDQSFTRLWKWFGPFTNKRGNETVRV